MSPIDSIIRFDQMFVCMKIFVFLLVFFFFLQNGGADTEQTRRSITLLFIHFFRPSFTLFQNKFNQSAVTMCDYLHLLAILSHPIGAKLNKLNFL